MTSQPSITVHGQPDLWFKKYKYITYFKCTDTCVSSVNKKHKNQYNRDQHQRPSNASSNHPCQRACCFCEKKKPFMITLITFYSEMERGFFQKLKKNQRTAYNYER